MCSKFFQNELTQLASHRPSLSLHRPSPHTSHTQPLPFSPSLPLSPALTLSLSRTHSHLFLLMDRRHSQGHPRSVALNPNCMFSITDSMLFPPPASPRLLRHALLLKLPGGLQCTVRVEITGLDASLGLIFHPAALEPHPFPGVSGCVSSSCSSAICPWDIKEHPSTCLPRLHPTQRPTPTQEVVHTLVYT